MAPWLELIAATSDRAALATIRWLWSSATRVDAVLADPERILRLSRDVDRTAGPARVRVVTARTPLTDPPPGWRWTFVTETPTPEFMLFYPADSAFPESALVFTGGAQSDGWLTYHRRPLVLHRLRERFGALFAEQDAAHLPRLIAAATSIREQPAELELVPSLDRADSDAAIDTVSPGELYRRVLAAHFADLPQPEHTAQRPATAPALAAHQERAYERACAILDRFGGVIVADAVGLGKTYIGLRLVERTLDSGGRGLVIVPAALRDQWQRELSYLGIDADSQPGRCGTSAHSAAGDTFDLWVREAGRVVVLSTESLGRRNFDPGSYRGADLVLVDEAHNFRNPSTQRYRNLSDLIRHSKVVLLTATPINNTILDLQHLIDLFAAPGAFRHLGVSDYREAFRNAAEGAGSVQPIISACVLRRTRRFLRAQYGEISVRDPLSDRELELHFPRRLPPVAVRYDLASTYGELFGHLETWLGELRFPSIDLGEEDRDSDDQLACSGELLKIILLKRLESSVEALRCTVVQQLAWCNTALRAIDAGRVLTRPDYRASFRGPEDDPGSQLAFFELMLPAPAMEPARIDEFRRLLENDMQILARIHAALVAVGPSGDRKLARLIELLDGPLSGRKVLIFTEFRDTARYIYHQLRHRPHLAQIDSGGARLGLERASRREVIERFAPHSNGVHEPPERERVDTLVATDVLSEGLNLQDAAVVVSYDLPWNPVRLMQRIGRIDRLGALAECVELYHFVPAHDLDRLLGLMARLQGKVSTISSALGLEHPVLATPGDRERALEQIRVLAHDPDAFERVEQEMEGPLDPEELAYTDRVTLFEDGPPASSERRAVSAVASADEATARAVAYWRVSCAGQHRGLWLVCDVASGCVVDDHATALEVLRNSTTHEAVTPPERLVDSARRACARYARGVLAHLQAAQFAGDALSPSLPQCRIAAWLSRSFEASAHRLTPDERALTDQLLERLARRFTRAGERSLSTLASELPERPDPVFCETLYDLLRSLDSEYPGPAELREVAVLLALPA
ncbi:MAG: DEAD/DEAH box helicase family protein [Gemmatimonadota bacterium]|nr:MAG: DEAD/DEAH box helicase family protein [Gemmatimonadota bacterium]